MTMFEGLFYMGDPGGFGQCQHVFIFLLLFSQSSYFAQIERPTMPTDSHMYF